MEFYTQYKRPPRKQDEFSNKMQPVYKMKTDKKTGKKEVYIEKEIDLYEKIQEYKDEISLTNLFKQYSLDPVKQLKDNESKIIDLTNIPENLMDMMNEIEKADNIWNKLSKETKQKFDNNKMKFLAASEDGQLAQMLHDEIKTKVSNFTQTQIIDRNPQPKQLDGQVTVEQYQQMTQPTIDPTKNNGGNL